ncbi:uncharacterized protein LOC132630443 isoform X2 [Lycium barbarum]|uniref:uncharacterized protein LOC132630443 isoform X2 n=1 Tax=Lycium barbarum TaxID=112863 RepID=UPI00293F220B|nr:uncharacterized protein LOC132630443 isoform X2 [Lycium barbarum]
MRLIWWNCSTIFATSIKSVCASKSSIQFLKTNLNPRLLDAWNCLDGCIAKKGDYHGAKNCFEFVLRMAPNSSVILRQLAQLELQFAPGEFRPLLKLLTLKF